MSDQKLVIVFISIVCLSAFLISTFVSIYKEGIFRETFKYFWNEHRIKGISFFVLIILAIMSEIIK